MRPSAASAAAPAARRCWRRDAQGAAIVTDQPRTQPHDVLGRPAHMMVRQPVAQIYAEKCSAQDTHEYNHRHQQRTTQVASQVMRWLTTWSTINQPKRSHSPPSYLRPRQMLQTAQPARHGPSGISLSPMLENKRAQFVLAESPGEFPIGKKRYQPEEQNRPNDHRSFPAPTTYWRKAFHYCLAMQNANKHFLDDIETHQDYAEYARFENNRID